MKVVEYPSAAVRLHVLPGVAEQPIPERHHGLYPSREDDCGAAVRIIAERIAEVLASIAGGGRVPYEDIVGLADATVDNALVHHSPLRLPAFFGADGASAAGNSRLANWRTAISITPA
jgi:hypothetical protein